VTVQGPKQLLEVHPSAWFLWQTTHLVVELVVLIAVTPPASQVAVEAKE